MIDRISSPIAQAPAEPKPRDTAEAAKQFEALLLNQMLQSARDAEEHEDQAGESMWSMASQQFAKVMADNGGVGIAKLVVEGLRQKPPVSAG